MLKRVRMGWNVAIPYRGTPMAWVRAINRAPIFWRRCGSAITWVVYGWAVGA